MEAKEAEYRIYGIQNHFYMTSEPMTLSIHSSNIYYMLTVYQALCQALP